MIAIGSYQSLNILPVCEVVPFRLKIDATATLTMAGLEKAMQLDTHVRNLLDMFANSGQPKIWELPPAQARDMALALTQMVEGKEPIGKMENGFLPGPEGPLSFRIYTPASAGSEPLACIVYFHGGAWIFGNLDTHDCMCRMLANASGCRVISVDYRLAPDCRRRRRLRRHQMGCR